MINVAIILASGTGERFQSKYPKQYHMLAGKLVFQHSLDIIIEANVFEKILFIGDKEYKKFLEKYENIIFVSGGKTRNESLKNALDYLLKDNICNSKLFITEAARPFLNGCLIKEYLDCLNDYDAVITAKNITDSLGLKDGSYANRDDYILLQAPEAYKMDTLNNYFNYQSEITSAIHQLPKNKKVKYNYDHNINLKITYPHDFLLAENLFNLKK